MAIVDSIASRVSRSDSVFSIISVSIMPGDTELTRTTGILRTDEPPVEGAARRLNAGEIGAIYTGRMEYGPRALNPLYYDVLAAFERESGLPALVNTSFNVHEEPIVNKPAECARALLDGRIDFIVTTQGIYQRIPGQAQPGTA